MLSIMQDHKEAFLSQWAEKFPDVPPPDLSHKEVDELEVDLKSCKSKIKELEENLSREKFHLIFLQTYLSAKKKTYTKDKWGYKQSQSSVDSDQEPMLEKDSVTPTTANINGNNTAENISDNMTDKLSDMYASVNKPKPVVKLRQNGDTEPTVNRLSKVFENVKLFEGRNSDVQPENVIAPQKSRKRTSYLEVWECKTGADKDSNNMEDKEAAKQQFVVQEDPEEEETSQEEEKEQPQVAKKPESGKSPVNPRGRKDYVEVWTCNTGDHVSVGVVYEDQDDFASPSLSAFDEIEDEDQVDYDLEDIDMKDGYGKRHYTMAGSDVKLRENSVNNADSNRLTWPAVAHQFQDGELDTENNLANAPDHFSASMDLSDLENSDSQHSEDSRQDSLDSLPEQPNGSNKEKSSTFPETSPLHKLRRAKTTNERMSVAFSAFSDWSDMPDRSSLLSMQSSEVLSTDEDYEHYDGASGEDNISVSTGNSIPAMNVANEDKQEKGESPTPIFVFSQPKTDPTSGIGNPVEIKSNVCSNSREELSGSPTKNAAAVSDMVDYQKVRSIAEAEKLRMRRWVLSSMLTTEEAYLEYLNTLLLYMKPLKATIGTSQPVMSAQDFDTLFFRVTELHDLHAKFYQKMKPRLDDWSADTAVGDLFKTLMSKLNLYGDYLNNYKRAQHTVEKCAKENEQFAQIIESLKVQSRCSKGSESISLVEVLYKPVERVMRTTLLLQDLLKHTPHRHPDYHTLRQVLKQAQHFLERINSTSSSSYKPRRTPNSAAAAQRSAHRELIKEGFLVEVALDGSRKLRHCFLYSDVLLCAKPKSTVGVFHNKASYECKWYIPLADLSFQPKEDSEAMPEIQATADDELRDLSNRAQQAKRDIAKERKRNKESPGHVSRKEERLRKKLAELEARIVLAAPDLPLRIYHMQGKSYMFLMSSDYERVEWLEAVMKQQESCFKSFTLTSLEINTLLTNCVKHKRDNVGSVLMKEDEDLLSGYLHVTIHSGQGFLRACNPYCTLEVDSYGQFQTKAKTRPLRNTKSPEWDAEFELELDGAQTLRILCYDRAREASAGASYDDDVLIAKGKVMLQQESLNHNGSWVKENVLMNELTIQVSVKFTQREKSLQRTLSKKTTGVFGVKIESVAKRDSTGIPNIVRKCVAEVERRGMGEIGIYRVSGVASEIQALKASFDTNRKDVEILLGEVDINAVAGVLKLYFRELPEPLFTNALYTTFVDASTMADPEVKQQTIMDLLSNLPVTNYKTLHYMRKHLIKVSESEGENKMNLHNLATVFGPTLLRPAEETAPPTPGFPGSVLSLNALRLDVHYQMDILLYCLELHQMLDYDGLQQSKNNKTAEPEKKRAPSSGYDNVALPSDGEKPEKKHSLVRSGTETSIKSASKVQLSKQKSTSSVHSDMLVPAPNNNQRYHPYEEIFIPSVRPPVGKKPSVSSKPKPAPRKTPLVKQSAALVTDL